MTDDKKTITRRANEKEARQLVEGNEAWTAAIAGIVGGWLVFVGSLSNALKIREQHDWPWNNLLDNHREWLFFGGIAAVAIGYPIMRFTKKTTKQEEAVTKINGQTLESDPEPAE